MIMGQNLICLFRRAGGGKSGTLYIVVWDDNITL